MRQPVRFLMTRLIACALAAAPLLAAAAAGHFTFVTGDVTLQKASGQKSTPERGSSVDAGDQIVTGASGMAQLTMVDQARLSLRPSTTFSIEAYPEKPDSGGGAILNLLRGTLRTFTGLLASTNRDKFVMKTRVATVGIRGSGNILYACDPGQCDESVTNGKPNTDPITVNHTIEGSHSVTNNPGPDNANPIETLITGPGQTVLVAGFTAPRYIPTPAFISNAAVTMTNKAAEPSNTASTETRNYSPSDAPALPPSQQPSTQVVTGNPVGFVSPVDATRNLLSDPVGLQDVILVAGSPFLSQATHDDLKLNGTNLTGYDSYPGSGSGVNPIIVGGTLNDASTVNGNGVTIYMGRYANASLSFTGNPGDAAPIPGSLHWIYAGSGYPTYLSDVLTGTATYTLAGSTAPTNQNNTAGTFATATLNVNFTARTLDFHANVSIPAASGNNGGSWAMSASNVPISFNQFAGSTTTGTLTITNGSTSSATNHALTGGFQGSLVGNGLTAAILGYGINDQTAANSSDWNSVSGVAAFTGTRQDNTSAYREGRISDPTRALSSAFIQSYATTDRPDEVTFDAQNRVISFSSPFGASASHSTYALGTATVVESGFDPDTGLTWGRWSGGVATVTGASGTSQNLDLTHASLHYIFAGSQSGPVALPLTGTASYTVIGSTTPTNGATLGTLNSATLNANFTNRTVDASVNLTMAGQTWNGAASGMPIYRDQYFSAYSGSPIPGVPNAAPLVITCTPSCGVGASGSFDGFFAGANGQRAGMMYNLGGNQGAVAFGRGPGG